MHLHLPLMLGTLLCVAGVHEKENVLYRQLLNMGVVSGGETLLTLPTPTVPDGLSAADQQAALESIPLRVPLSLFLRDSVVATYAISMGDLIETGAGPRLRCLDIWFVAYGDLQVLRENRQLLESFLRESESEVRSLGPEELAERGITSLPDEAEETAFGHAVFTLLDRVRLSVTTRSVYSQSEESTVLASQLDSRFADDPELPNQWRPLEMTSRVSSEGNAQPYHVSASYWKATQLHDMAGAILVEYHSVFEQPAGWFGGRDRLRSKLPLAVQNEVRTFRRKLKKAMD